MAREICLEGDMSIGPVGENHVWRLTMIARPSFSVKNPTIGSFAISILSRPIMIVQKLWRLASFACVSVNENNVWYTHPFRYTDYRLWKLKSITESLNLLLLN